MRISPNAKIVARFIKKNWHGCKAWTNAGMQKWVQWYINADRCLIVTDKGAIQCVTLFRNVEKPEQAEDAFANNLGPVNYIELCVSRSKLAMQGAFLLLANKTKGFASHVCWVRAKYANRFTMMTMQDAARHFTPYLST